MPGERGPTCFERVKPGRVGNILLPSHRGGAMLLLHPRAGSKRTERYCLGQPDGRGRKSKGKLSKVGVYCFLPALPRPKRYPDFWVALFRHKAFKDFDTPAKGVKYLAWARFTKQEKERGKKRTGVQVALDHVITVNREDRVTGHCVDFSFGHAALRINPGATLVVNEARNGFRITDAVELVPGARPGTPVPVQGVDVLIPEDDRQGTLEFDVALDEAALDALDVGLHYAWALDGGEPRAQRYPVFSVAEGATGVHLRCSLDPFAEDDPARFAFTDGAAPIASYLRTTHGAPLTLTPRGVGTDQAPALAFNTRPDTRAPCLTPTGTFALGGTPDHGDVLPLMGGLSGSEMLLLSRGDTLTFVADRPALAEGLVLPGTDDATAHGAPTAPALTDGFKTAWVRVDPAEPGGAGSDPTFGYCVQPEHATYYANAGFDFPLAAGARISPLAPGRDGARATVPLAPYAGLRLGDGAAAAVSALERQLLEPTRRALVDVDGVDGPRFFDPASGAPLAGGFARTPRGLLVALNDGSEGPTGTWKRLVLAASPENPGQVLAIDAARKPLQPPSRPATSPAVVSPILSNALMDDGLFMVVSDPTYLGTFTDNAIRLGDFTFRLDVGPDATILLLKLTAGRSVRQLVEQPALWSERDLLVGAEKLAGVQARIRGWLDEAAGAENAIFDRFDRLVDDPGWTGILALNCGLDAAAFPPEIQLLLGGIDGELRARYLAVTVSQVDSSGAAWSVEKSSLDALVHYAHDLDLPADEIGFQVRELDALFANSALIRFGVKIALGLPTLFRAGVRLASTTEGHRLPPILTLEGAHQRNDGTYGAGSSRQGSMVLDARAPRTFAVEAPATGRRVLAAVRVDDATLVPESSEKAEDQTIVRSRIALGGRLDFDVDVSPDGAGIDLFSFGSEGAGLAFSDYAIEMTTVIEKNAGTLGPLTASAAAVQVSAVGVEPREESLVRALPIAVGGFRGAELDRTTARSSIVTGGYLVDAERKESAPSLTDEVPDFALSLSLSLGSLGALSSAADSLDAEILLGWKTWDTETGDQVSMWLVPPAEMRGVLGFAIEGVIGSTFDALRLIAVDWSKDGSAHRRRKVFVIQLVGVQADALGIPLLPSATNFTLFADPEQGDASNLGWLLTARQAKAGTPI